MESYKKLELKVVVTKDGIVRNNYIIDANNVVIRCDENGYPSDYIDPITNFVYPAIEALNGTHVEHWRHGMLHCETGPAIIDTEDGYEEWWYKGFNADPIVIDGRLPLEKLS